MNLFRTKKPFAAHFHTSAEYYSEMNLQPVLPNTSEAETGKRRTSLRKYLKPFSKTAVNAATKASVMLEKMPFLEKVSPRAIYAAQCLSSKTRPADRPVSRWLAEDGLRCVANDGTTEAMSFAISMIQHATGYYGPMSGAAHTMQPKQVEKMNGLINNLAEQIRSGAVDSNGTILIAINNAFPNAKLSARVLNGNTDDFTRGHRSVANNGAGSCQGTKDVQLLWEDGRFKAIVADQSIVDLQRGDEAAGPAQPRYRENCERASLAASELQKILTTKIAGNRVDHGQPASDTNPALTDPAVINRALMPLNIERVANNTNPEISLIAGLLRHATGVYEKDDLPVAGRLFVTEDEPLHALEARIILAKINADSTDEDLGVPIGAISCDKRIQMVIEQIAQRHSVKLNVMLVESRSNGLHQTGLFSARRDENGAQLNDSSATSTTYALLHNGSSFEPLRKSVVKLHPKLHLIERWKRKSLYGRSKAMIENAYSPFRRAAHRMSDDELIAHTTVFAATHGRFRSRAYQKELNKRQNTDRFDHGTQTLTERFKLGFRNLSHADNPYAKKNSVELLKILKDEDERPFLILKEKRLIQAAATQNDIESTIPSKLQASPPAPRSLAKETDIVAINEGFKQLMRAIDIKTLKEDWAEAQFDSNGAAPDPWAQSSLLYELESGALEAWNCAQQGFSTGTMAYLDNTVKHLRKALIKFKTAEGQFFSPTADVGTKQFMTAGSKINYLLQALENIKEMDGLDSREKSVLNSKERERLANGLTVAEVEALANMPKQKLDFINQKRLLQNRVPELIAPLNLMLEEIDTKKYGINRIADTSTTHEVVRAATIITSITKNRLRTLRNRTAQKREEREKLGAVIAALELCENSPTGEDAFDATGFAAVNGTVSALIEKSANNGPQISLGISGNEVMDIKLLTSEQRKILISEIGALYKTSEHNLAQIQEDAETVQTNMTQLERLVRPLQDQQTSLDRKASQITALEELDWVAAEESQRKADSELRTALNSTKVQALRDEASPLVAAARIV